MSFEAIKPYFKLRCEAVGLTEHEDAFNIDNIPETVLDDSFHISITGFNGNKQNQNDQEILFPVEIIFYKKGDRYPSEGIDNALLKAEALIKEVQRPSLRLGTVIKNISTSNALIEPMDASNDNVVRVRITFNLTMTLNLD